MNPKNHAALVIGCGSIGERHLRCFQLTGRASVTACDTDSSALDRIGNLYRVKTISNWMEACNSGDHSIAVVCTPSPLHVPIALHALSRKMHVLVEKPLSNSFAGVDELLRLAKMSAAQSAVAYVLHVFPFLVEARAFLQGGGLGPIRQIAFASGQPFHQLRPGYARSYYRDRRTGGGAIQDALTHSANWIESVVGPTDSLLCDCSHQVLPGVEVEDTVHIAARNGPVLVSYALNQFQAPNESTIQFNAEAGSVKIEMHNQRWGVWMNGATSWTWHDARVPDRDAHFVAQAEAFMDQIEGAPPRLCSLDAAAQTLRFNLAALASSESGNRINTREIHA
jgi:predicted dehydrogenase